MTHMTALPSGFLIGSATAAHQIEGGNVNTDLWVKEWWPSGGFAEPSGDACDSYHRYGEDIALLAGAGLNAYRFGVEWSRIEPELGWYPRAELDHYKRMVATCLDHGVSPMVTLNHFSGPRWFARIGGWGHASAADYFARFAEKVTQHLGDLVPYMCTINEANILSTVFNIGMAPAGHADDELIVHGAAPAKEIAAHLAEAREDPGQHMGAWPSPELAVMANVHRKAREAIKSVRSEIKVGWSLAIIDVQAAEGGEERRDKAVQMAQLDWLDVSADDDFVGVQTYSRERMSADGLLPRPEGSDRTLTGWEVYPVALEHTLRLAAGRVNVPILVTENGIATADDAQRIAYTTEALQAIGRCLADGIDIRGYYHWTLLDNFEWTAGFAPTFGLIAVNRETFERTPKPSLAWLGEVLRAGVLP